MYLFSAKYVIAESISDVIKNKGIWNACVSLLKSFYHNIILSYNGSSGAAFISYFQLYCLFVLITYLLIVKLIKKNTLEQLSNLLLIAFIVFGYSMGVSLLYFNATISSIARVLYCCVVFAVFMFKPDYEFYISKNMLSKITAVVSICVCLLMCSMGLIFTYTKKNHLDESYYEISKLNETKTTIKNLGGKICYLK